MQIVHRKTGLTGIQTGDLLAVRWQRFSPAPHEGSLEYNHGTIYLLNTPMLNYTSGIEPMVTLISP